MLEVEGVHFRLLGATEQEAVLAGFAAWLNGLTYPVQVLARAAPLDLDRRLDHLERRADLELPPTLAVLAHDHAAFFRSLARDRLLLERHFYVVVPAGDVAPRLHWPFGRRAQPLDAAGARRLLTVRCDDVTSGLGRCRAVARRLTSLDLAELLYACWCPERARLQRLRAELVDYAALAVHSSSPVERSA